MIRVTSSRDVVSAEAIVALGWPEIEPYFDKMAFLRLDGNYPVAQVFAPRLIGLGM